MPSFKNQEPMIELPKLISLDIIDLNKRLRERKNRIGSNLWDLLPDDVMPNIVKYKVKMDFDSKWDYNLIVSKYNSLYDYNTLNHIAIKILDDNDWDFRDYLKEKKKGVALCDDYYDEFCRERLFEFVIFKLQEKGDLNYLKYFNEYTKKEVVLKRFKVGKTYYKTFKNIDTKETIKIPFTITKRDDVITIGIECKGHFTANIDGTDINVRLTINYEEDKKRKDDDNLYINEYTELTFCKNRDLERYLKYNNLKIIRYRMNA
jgi:hypothetical protein